MLRIGNRHANLQQAYIDYKHGDISRQKLNQIVIRARNGIHAGKGTKITGTISQELREGYKLHKLLCPFCNR